MQTFSDILFERNKIFHIGIEVFKGIEEKTMNNFFNIFAGTFFQARGLHLQALDNICSSQVICGDETLDAIFPEFSGSCNIAI